jgi:hypothetical protein
MKDSFVKGFGQGAMKTLEYATSTFRDTGDTPEGEHFWTADTNAYGYVTGMLSSAAGLVASVSATLVNMGYGQY